MENDNNLKALYIIVNAGFADEVVEIARQAGAGGGTIINARGSGPVHKSIMGITVDTEKEIILSIVNEDAVENIMAAIQQKAGLNSPANGICFIMPVEKCLIKQ
ncbi:P-II family nitrogen regulator [Desulfitobacterium hafniense]|uniref:P-II family nitrogen regulator n=1 Tax=Desulfitobacterium hafniense TaxID=49338 RepID=UPI0003782D12|nr:P-II family nitrogen regulator [Desulfitobacterium hafniense]